LWLTFEITKVLASVGTMIEVTVCLANLFLSIVSPDRLRALKKRYVEPG
jgi:hypothetical protein